MQFNSFWSDVIATIFGGGVLAFIFFLIKEVLMPPPDISGRWYFSQTTVSTAYNPFKKMQLTYVAMVWREGLQLMGTVEKVHEHSSTQSSELTGVRRTRGDLTGAILKRYILADKVHIHLVEEGPLRVYTTLHSLSQYGPTFEGEFFSTSGDQQGTVIWSRNISDVLPTSPFAG